MSEPPKRKELFEGQLQVQYTSLSNNGFGITPHGIPRFLRWIPPTDLGARCSLQLLSHCAQLSESRAPLV